MIFEPRAFHRGVSHAMISYPFRCSSSCKAYRVAASTQDHAAGLALRASEVVQLRESMKSKLPDSLVFFLQDPTKNERERSSRYRAKSKPPQEIFRFKDDPDLCPVSHVDHYLDRTKQNCKGKTMFLLAI